MADVFDGITAQHDQVRALSRLNRADVAQDAKRLRAVPRRDAKDRHGRDSRVLEQLEFPMEADAGNDPGVRNPELQERDPGTSPIPSSACPGDGAGSHRDKDQRDPAERLNPGGKEPEGRKRVAARENPCRHHAQGSVKHQAAGERLQKSEHAHQRMAHSEMREYPKVGLAPGDLVNAAGHAEDGDENGGNGYSNSHRQMVTSPKRRT